MRAAVLAAALSLGMSLTLLAIGPAARPIQADAQATAEEVAFRQGALPDSTSGLTKPQIIRDNLPKYTSDAMRAKLQGDAKVEVVVGINGAVERARIVESVDRVFGLDAEALKAAKQDLFTPALLNGQPVAVWTTITMTFRIH